MYTATTRVVGSAIQPALNFLSSALTPTKPSPSPTVYPTRPPPAPPPTPPAALDAALASLSKASEVWALTDLKTRAALFRATMRTTREVKKKGDGGKVSFCLDPAKCRSPLTAHHLSLFPTYRPSSPPPRPPSRPKAPTAVAKARK